MFSQLEYDGDAVWSLLLAAGYLKVQEAPVNTVVGEPLMYKLSLTNLEVNHTFRLMINGWFKSATVKDDYNGFVHYFLEGDLDAMNEYMNDVTEAVFSSFDVGRKPSGKSRPERFYHGFVLGLIVELQKTHKVTSNGERGFERYDIMIKPLDVTAGKPAFIIEFKVKNERKGEKSLEDTAAAALA